MTELARARVMRNYFVCFMVLLLCCRIIYLLYHGAFDFETDVNIRLLGYQCGLAKNQVEL